jgi:hypothetical protein
MACSQSEIWRRILLGERSLTSARLVNKCSAANAAFDLRGRFGPAFGLCLVARLRPPAPVLPDGSSVDQNIADAAANSAGSWVKKVFPHGSWDYKRYPGGWRKWDYAGNFNYGATGRAVGMPDAALVGAAA